MTSFMTWWQKGEIESVRDVSEGPFIVPFEAMEGPVSLLEWFGGVMK